MMVDDGSLLFKKCKETHMRFKKYNIDSARLDGRDIVNKLNGVGVDCPIFVAKDVSKLPLATPDAFDLAKMSKNINDVLKIEENVMSSFPAFSCLQNDFQAVTECWAKIDGIIRIARDLADVKTAIAKKSRNVISDTSTSENGVFSDTDADTTFHSGHQTAEDVGTTTDAEDVGTNNDAEEVVTRNNAGISDSIPLGIQNHRKHKDTVKHPVLRLRDCPPNMATWMTQDGYRMVDNNKQVNKHKSEYVNSDRQPRSDDIKLKIVKLNRYSNHNRNNGYSRGDHGQCVLFVSRLE